MFLLRLLVLTLLLSLSTLGFALDESRLWLPKKYKGLMPKFITAALEAESTERCQKVINGQFVPNKTTEDYYYFVITCRDIERRTYNISYRYPVDGGDLESTEQKVKRKPAAVANPSSDEELSEELAETAAEPEPEIDQDQEDWGDWGSWDDIANEEQTELAAFAEAEEEPDDWGDWGDWETILSEIPDEQAEDTFDPTVDGDETDEELWGDWGDWDTVMGRKAQLVDESGSAIQLGETDAAKICEDKLSERTRMMIDVSIDQSQLVIEKGDEAGAFTYRVPFTAKNPLGRDLFYRAICEVSVYDGVNLTLQARKKRR